MKEQILQEEAGVGSKLLLLVITPKMMILEQC